MNDPILDALDDALAARLSAETPIEKARAQMALAYCNWALAHDITERLFGDPNWFTMPPEYQPVASSES